MRYIVCLLPLLVAGCANPPSSSVPLTRDTENVLDERIVGEWQLTSAKPKPERRPIISLGTLDGIVATISTETASRYKVTLQRDDSSISFTCTLSKIDDSFYIDLQHPPIHDAAIAGTTLRPHFLVKCAFVDKQIRLTGCDGMRFKEILESEKMPFAEVDSAVVFTGTSDQLHDIIRDNNAELFRASMDDLILTLRRPNESDNKAVNRNTHSRGN